MKRSTRPVVVSARSGAGFVRAAPPPAPPPPAHEGRTAPMKGALPPGDPPSRGAGEDQTLRADRETRHEVPPHIRHSSFIWGIASVRRPSGRSGGAATARHAATARPGHPSPRRRRAPGNPRGRGPHRRPRPSPRRPSPRRDCSRRRRTRAGRGGGRCRTPAGAARADPRHGPARAAERAAPPSRRPCAGRSSDR